MLLPNHTEEQRIFQELDEMLVFDNKNTEENTTNKTSQREDLFNILQENGLILFFIKRKRTTILKNAAGTRYLFITRK